jgi:hypothetical protein
MKKFWGGAKAACDREEIEKRMDELARKFVENRNPEIIEKLYILRLELARLNSRSDWDQRKARH